MELLAVAGLFAVLALLAAIPLVLLLHFTRHHRDDNGWRPAVDRAQVTER